MYFLSAQIIYRWSEKCTKQMTQKLGFLKVLEASMFAVIDFQSEGGKIQYIDLF